VLITSRRFLSAFRILAIEFQELHGRGLFEFQAQTAGDLAQGMVEVWEVIDGHVADEGAANFVVTRAAMKPAKEDEELNAGGEGDDDPVWVHGGGWTAKISDS